MIARVGVYDKIWLEKTHGNRMWVVGIDVALDESLTQGLRWKSTLVSA
ncbi:hypothetical protein ACFL6U_25170 [Planctomycetota bacterium]